MTAANDLEEQLEKFKVSMSNSGEDEHEQVKIIERISSILPSAEDSLKIKQKGQRISYHERVHLYKQMKKGE